MTLGRRTYTWLELSSSATLKMGDLGRSRADYPADTRNINGGIDLWLGENSDCRADTRKCDLYKHLCPAAFVSAVRHRVARLFLYGSPETVVQTVRRRQRNPIDFTAENAENAETGQRRRTVA